MIQLPSPVAILNPAPPIEPPLLRCCLQDWTPAMHCFSQARDKLRHAACEARPILDTQRTRAHRAAVLLVEAAAGAARRHEQQRGALAGRYSSGSTGSSGSGSSGSSGAQLPPVTPAEYGEWLDLAAGLYSLVLGKPSVALALYCQVGVVLGSDTQQS